MVTAIQTCLHSRWFIYVKGFLHGRWCIHVDDNEFRLIGYKVGSLWGASHLFFPSSLTSLMVDGSSIPMTFSMVYGLSMEGFIFGSIQVGFPWDASYIFFQSESNQLPCMVDISSMPRASFMGNGSSIRGFIFVDIMLGFLWGASYLSFRSGCTSLYAGWFIHVKGFNHDRWFIHMRLHLCKY